MIKYRKGIIGFLLMKLSRIKFLIKSLQGFIFNYKVYRPNVDHTVYRNDNIILRSNFLFASKVVHQVSLPKGFSPDRTKTYIIEIEHPFALYGHLGVETDYGVWKHNFLDRGIKDIVSAFSQARFIIICSSLGCKSALIGLIPQVEDLAEIITIYWSAPLSIAKFKISLKEVEDKKHYNLSVFHYSGARPISKGFFVVLEIAKRMENVLFYEIVDLSIDEISELDVPHNLKLVSSTRRNYYSFLNLSDVVLVLNFLDGWGVYLDALSHGKPIVSLNTYDKSEVVFNNFNGFQINSQIDFYKDFLSFNFKNLDDFEKFLLDYTDNLLFEEIINCFMIYINDSRLLYVHSKNSLQLSKTRFSWNERNKALSNIYINV